MLLVLLGSYIGCAIVLFVTSYLYHRFVMRVGVVSKYQMPDGRYIHLVLGDIGALFVYREIFEMEVYTRYGLSLEGVPSPLIVDAGANIGLFSKFMAERYPTAKIVGAEPVQQLVDVFEKNTAFASDRVHISRVALGKSTGGTAVVEYIPNISCGSGLVQHIEEATKKATGADGIEMLRALLCDFGTHRLLPSFFPLDSIARLLQKPYLRVLVAVALLPVLLLALCWARGMHMRKVRYPVPVVSMKSLLESYHNVPTNQPIDLMKIDIEGSELEVLEGMDEALWRRVQRMHVETQDIDGRIEAIRALLQSKGFRQVREVPEELEVHKILRVTSFFAVR